MAGVKYENLALKLVPKGHDRSRGDLRVLIAQAIDVEVEKALAKQRAENFPELAALEASLKKQTAELEALTRKRGMEHEERVLDLSARDRKTTAGEARLKAVLAAVDAFDKWCQGEGPTDETMKRIDDLRSACAAFREKK